MCLAFSMSACSLRDYVSEKLNGSEETSESDDSKEEDSDKKDSDKGNNTDETTDDTAKKVEPTVALNYKLSDYVTLGKYKEVEYKAYSTEVTDEEVEKKMNSYIQSLGLLVDVDREIKNGDYAVITFAGTMNGKEDGNLAGTSMTLGIGTGQFIPGFEEGLIGHKKGEEVSLDLTFPDDYGAKEYAGKPVTFKVSIEKVQKLPAVDDAFMKKNFGDDSEVKDQYGWNTVKEANEAITSDIKRTKEELADDYKLQDVVDAIINDCKFETLPEDYVDEYYNSNIDYYQGYADYYSQTYGTEMTLEQYANTVYGVSLDALKEQCKEYAIESVKQDIALFAIAEEEKIEITEEDYNSKVEELFSSYKDSAGYTESSQFVEANGGEDTVKLRLRILAARDWVIEKSVQNGTYTERE